MPRLELDAILALFYEYELNPSIVNVLPVPVCP